MPPVEGQGSELPNAKVDILSEQNTYLCTLMPKYVSKITSVQRSSLRKSFFPGDFLRAPNSSKTMKKLRMFVVFFVSEGCHHELFSELGKALGGADCVCRGRVSYMTQCAQRPPKIKSKPQDFDDDDDDDDDDDIQDAKPHLVVVGFFLGLCLVIFAVLLALAHPCLVPLVLCCYLGCCHHPGDAQSRQKRTSTHEWVHEIAHK